MKIFWMLLIAFIVIIALANIELPEKEYSLKHPAKKRYI